MRLAPILLLLAPLANIAAETKPLPGSPAELAQGEKLFRHHCGMCHGPKGEGSRGPALTRPKLRRAPDDETLVKIVDEGIRGTEMPGADGIMSDNEVRQTAAYVRSLGKVALKPVPGDAVRGAEIYRMKGTCAACHSIRGEGGVAGPDLTGIGERRSAEFLRESVVDPQAAVPDGYLLVTVTPKNGKAVTGARVNEDSFSIQLRDNTGRHYSFLKADLAKIDKQRGKSGMPSFRGRLAEDELTDVVAYLVSLVEEK